MTERSICSARKHSYWVSTSGIFVDVRDWYCQNLFCEEKNKLVSFDWDNNFLPSFCNIIGHKFILGNKFVNLSALLESGLPETLDLENLVKRQV